MTEIQLHSNPAVNNSLLPPQPGAELLDGQIRLDSQNILGEIEQVGIQVEDSEGVAVALDVLRNEFVIDDAVFAEPKGRMVMTAIADQFNRVNKSDAVSPSTYNQHSVYSRIGLIC